MRTKNLLLFQKGSILWEAKEAQGSRTSISMKSRVGVVSEERSEVRCKGGVFRRTVTLALMVNVDGTTERGRRIYAQPNEDSLSMTIGPPETRVESCLAKTTNG